MPEVRSPNRAVAELVAVAVRSFLTTLLAVAAVGAVLAATSAYLLREQPLHAAIAATIALAEAGALGVVFGANWALVMALAEGARSLERIANSCSVFSERWPAPESGGVSARRWQARSVTVPVTGGLTPRRSRGRYTNPKTAIALGRSAEWLVFERLLEGTADSAGARLGGGCAAAAGRGGATTHRGDGPPARGAGRG